MIHSPPDFSASFQGIDEGPEGLKLISDIIREKMGIDISVLMGANIASEVAAEKFCETTIGEAQAVLGVSLRYLPPPPAPAWFFLSSLLWSWRFRASYVLHTCSTYELKPVIPVF